jgi:branched-subunit amino acid aminotransferase/4-amino-4-deoxychorismate lyase
MTAISLDSPAVAHGLGLFETMLSVDGRVLHVDAHLARMLASCAALGLPAPEAGAFHRAIAAAIEPDAKGERALRCLWLASADGWILSARSSAIPSVTLSRREHGRAITLDRSFTRSLPHHKLTSYAVCDLGLRRAIEAGADEALFVSAGGGVLEGTSTNVFAVDRDRLITAPVDSGILPGIVREWVIGVAAQLGVAVEQRPPTSGELRHGGFLTSSLTELAPLRELDGDACQQPGELFVALRRRWLEETRRA